MASITSFGQQPARTGTDYLAALNKGWEEVKTKGVSKLEDFLTNGDKIQFSKKEYMQLYTIIYNLSTTQIESYPSELYKRYTECIQNYLNDRIVPKMIGLTEAQLLAEMNLRWQNHQIMVRYLKCFFQYLDRFHVEMHSITNLQDQGMKQFKLNIVDRMINQLITAVLNQIAKERIGDQTDVESGLLAKITEALMFLSSDKICTEGVNPIQELEQRLLEQTRQHFRKQAEKMISECDLAGYLSLADKILVEERTRFNTYLTWDSIDNKIVAEFQKEILIRFQNEIFVQNNALVTLFQEQRFEILALLYKLYQPVENGLKPVTDKFREHMKQVGTSIVKAVQTHSGEKELSLKELIQNSQIVEKLSEQYLLFQQFIIQSFKNDSLFTRQVEISHQEFMNLDVGKHSMAEILATYTDKILSKGGNKESGLTVEEVMEQQVKLFTFLIDKDLYIEVYHNNMARRMLQDRSEDAEAEKQMITKLKINCGLVQIKRLEGMISDLELAKTEFKAFEETTAYQQRTFDFQIQCLTLANWPTYKKFKIPLPPVLNNHWTSFVSFYTRKHQKRELQLCYSLGQAVIQMQLSPQKKPTDLVVSTISMFILLMFNEKESFTVQEMADLLLLDIETVKKNLQVLSMQKNKILNIQKLSAPQDQSDVEMSEGHSQQITTSASQSIAQQVVTLNQSFSTNYMRLNLPIPALEEVLKKEKVTDDRQHAIDSAIIRIMKTRKRLDVLNLTNEVLISLTMFKPQLKSVKIRIERLIEQGYLKRDDEDKGVLHYLA